MTLAKKLFKHLFAFLIPILLDELAKILRVGYTSESLP